MMNDDGTRKHGSQRGPERRAGNLARGGAVIARVILHTKQLRK